MWVRIELVPEMTQVNSKSPHSSQAIQVGVINWFRRLQLIRILSYITLPGLSTLVVIL